METETTEQDFGLLGHKVRLVIRSNQFHYTGLVTDETPFFLIIKDRKDGTRRGFAKSDIERWEVIE